MTKQRSYGKIIRDNRARVGLTQREFGDRVGCSDSFIAHLEREVKLPSVEVCLAIAAVFELSDDEEVELQKAVEQVRAERSQSRIRTRGRVVREVIRGRGVPASRPPEKTERLTGPRVARALAADPDLEGAYRDLVAALGDARTRQAAIAALRAFAQLAES